MLAPENARQGTNNHAFLGRLAAALATAFLSSGANAQTLTREGGLEKFASEALATFGLVAIPNESASTLAISNAKANDTAFRSFQIGGGDQLIEDLPLWFEGYVGFQRYDPQFVLNNGSTDLTVRAKWTGASATGGIGWSFRLAKNWSFRPIVNLSLGRVVSDVTVAGAPPKPPGSILDFLGSGGLTVGGFGGSLLLDYEERSALRDLDFTMRFSRMRLETIGTSSNIDASADVATAAAWVRARYPIPDFRILGHPTKSVWEASLSSYPGDQGKLLDIDWLGSLGVGLELGTENTGLPLVSRARLVARYVFGDNYDGFSLGLGVSF